MTENLNIDQLPASTIHAGKAKLEYDTIRAQENSLTRLIAQASSADQRAALALTTNLAMLGVMASITGSVRVLNLHQWHSIFGLVAIALNIISLMFVSYVTFPRFDRTRTASSVFYGAIARMTGSDYDHLIKQQTDLSYLEDLNAQCFFMAGVCNTKFLAVRHALITLFAAIIPWLTAIVITFRTAP